MSQRQVSHVMSTDVVTVHDDAPVAQVASLLTERQISAVPVVDRFDTVTGIVSWTDLRDTVEVGDVSGEAAGRWLPAAVARLRWPNLVAVDVMSAPPVTIGPDASLAAAGRLMHRRKVGRLLVVDDRRRLLGIVTRGDLLKTHDRPDTAIREEVTQRILHATLMIPAGDVEAAVADGVVTLTGHTKRRTTALAAVAMTVTIPGVTEVVDRIAYDTDDIGSAPTPSAADPLDDWWHQAASLPFNGSHPFHRRGFDRKVAA